MSSSEITKNLKLKDYSKYLLAMLAPKEHRNHLLAIFGLYTELSQVPLEVSEPMVGLIKLQWWRDVFAEIKEGKPPRPHPILLALKNENIQFDKIEKIINAFQDFTENGSPKTIAELETFLNNTEVVILNYAAEVIGAQLNQHQAMAYALANVSAKISRYKKFELTAEQLANKSQELLNSSKSVLYIITKHLIKFGENRRYSLLLKLALHSSSLF